jgi:hypothetical protein
MNVTLQGGGYIGVWDGFVWVPSGMWLELTMA